MSAIMIDIDVLRKKIKSAVDYLSNANVANIKAKYLIVLGSGLSEAIDDWEMIHAFAYKQIPGFPKHIIEGHKGEVRLYKINNTEGDYAWVLTGRFHSYQGYDPAECAIPIRVAACLGVSHVILTCAAGGINQAYNPGDIMFLNDHINSTGMSPFRGANLEEYGPQFLDLTQVYDDELLQHFKHAAKQADINTHEGVYVWHWGPEYETPAEIKRWSILGGDAIGMSMVPEAMVARHHQLKVAGIACISNKAAGMSDQGRKGKLDHKEVLEVGQHSSQKLKQILNNYFNNERK
ncbi:purine-nucleoside phosphorylase [bacterium]|nr:purine-nucleoside phosphorylase [bacterium]